jgi:nickel-dependent lactate racemase
MKKKAVLMDYGEKGIEIEVPEDAYIVKRKDPSALADTEEAFFRAISNPIAMPPLPELVHKGSRVTIAFDAPPRSGIPRRLAITLILKELAKVGISDRDVTLICASATQRKRTASELRENLGAEIFDKFWPFRLKSHDCTQNLVNLGVTDLGDFVEHNAAVAESDVLVYLGTVVPIPWGGFTGIGVVVGLGSARSIESHHTEVIAHPESCHGDPKTMLYMKHKLAIHSHIEKVTGKKIFYVDAATNAKGEVSAVFAGHCPEILEPEWSQGESFFRVSVPQGDILIMGLPQQELYGLTHNPLLALTYAAMPFRTWVNKPLIRKGGVVIILAKCNGSIDERIRPSDGEVIKLFGNCFSALDLRDFKEEFLTREDLIYRYRHCNAFHPIHSIWLFYEDQYLLDHSGKVIFAGEVNPGAIRQLGCAPARDFDQAWNMALEVVGKKPDVLVVPRYFTRDRVQFFVE